MDEVTAKPLQRASNKTHTPKPVRGYPKASGAQRGVGSGQAAPRGENDPARKHGQDWFDSDDEILLGTASSSTSSHEEGSQATDGSQQSALSRPYSDDSVSSHVERRNSPARGKEAAQHLALRTEPGFFGTVHAAEKRVQELGKVVNALGFKKPTELLGFDENHSGWPRQASTEGSSKNLRKGAVIRKNKLPKITQTAIAYRANIVRKQLAHRPYTDQKLQCLSKPLSQIQHELATTPPKAGTGLFRDESVTTQTWLVYTQETQMRSYINTSTAQLLWYLEQALQNLPESISDLNLEKDLGAETQRSPTECQAKVAVLTGVIYQYVADLTAQVDTLPPNLCALLTGTYDYLAQQAGAVGCNDVVPALLMLRTLCPAIFLVAVALKPRITTSDDDAPQNTQNSVRNSSATDDFPPLGEIAQDSTALGPALWEAVLLLKYTANNPAQQSDKLDRYGKAANDVANFAREMQPHFNALCDAIVTRGRKILTRAGYAHSSTQPSSITTTTTTTTHTIKATTATKIPKTLRERGNEDIVMMVSNEDD